MQLMDGQVEVLMWNGVCAHMICSEYIHRPRGFPDRAGIAKRKFNSYVGLLSLDFRPLTNH